jgi:hypothetical protein
MTAPSALTQTLISLSACMAIGLIGKGAYIIVPPAHPVQSNFQQIAETDVESTPVIVTRSSHDAQTGKWSRLSSLQRKVLGPLQEEWVYMQPAQRQKWLEVAARYTRFSAVEQERIQARMLEWARLKPAERGFARLNFRGMQKLSAQERQRLWQAYLDLSPEEREDLAQRAQSGAKLPLLKSPRKRTTQTASKSNILVGQEPNTKARAVSPTQVQPGIGATTVPINQPESKIPPHQIVGAPKILASATFVNPSTLLPPAQ